MKPIPSGNLRSNLGTWAVRDDQLPAVACAMLDALPRESFDPGFRGQHLETTYFDTKDFLLRKARVKGGKYLTLRVRCYRQDEGDEDGYAFSAKTEGQKIRSPIEEAKAHFLLAGDGITPVLLDLLPPDLQARLLELAGDEPLVPVVTVCGRRYAAENAADRLTLDTGVRTDKGDRIPFNILEFKSSNPDDPAPGAITALGLRPIKSSKFLWATREL
jgi:hypothetical protein